MSQSERLNKLRSAHLTVNKTYPPYIEHTDVIVGYESINSILFDDVRQDIVKLPIRDMTKSSPCLYQNINTRQYYLQYIHHKEELFDVTNDYDWDKVLQCNVLKPEFKTTKTKHIVSILENKVYYPGSTEYDRVYPPVQQCG